MRKHCGLLAEHRWGKFVVYNWVKLNPTSAIPHLLDLKQLDLYNMCTNKQG